jgi:hypothetical protein
VKPSPRRERLAVATAAAAADRAAERARLAALEATGVAVGDLRVLALTGAWPVEWAVIEADPRSGRWLTAPADTQPLAGGSDLETDVAGPLVIRCGAALWVEEEVLAAGPRTGQLPPSVVERARFLHRQTVAGRRAPDAEQAAAERDADHRRWVEDVVTPARAMLLARSAALGGAPPRSFALPTRLLGLAASVLLLVSLSAGWGFWRETGRAERLTVERRDLERRLAAAEREGELAARETAALRARLARLQAAGDATPAATPEPATRPLLNVPFVWLAPQETVRGEPAAVRLPAGGELFVLIVPLDDPTRPGPYRLTVREQASRRTVWSSDGLMRSGVAELSVALPPGLFAPGDYVVDLATAGSGTRHLADFPLRIVAGTTQRKSSKPAQ